VGYAGGTKASPTYDAIGNHVESVEVTYDPEVVSYDQLLALFWKSHDPSANPYANQYSSLILVTDDSQLAHAKASAHAYEETSGDKVLTRIERFTRFYPAEDYHQKYYLRQDRTLARAFHAMFGDDQVAFRDSAAAARINGYVSGYGTKAQLAREIGSLGLAEKARAYLAARVKSEGPSAACATVSP